MFKVEISNDTADKLFQDILLQDYKGLVRDISNAEKNLEDLQPYEFEDLVAWRRYRDAIAVMFEYYLTEDQRNEVLATTA